MTIRTLVGLSLLLPGSIGIDSRIQEQVSQKPVEVPIEVARPDTTSYVLVNDLQKVILDWGDWPEPEEDREIPVVCSYANLLDNAYVCVNTIRSEYLSEVQHGSEVKSIRSSKSDESQYEQRIVFEKEVADEFLEINDKVEKAVASCGDQSVFSSGDGTFIHRAKEWYSGDFPDEELNYSYLGGGGVASIIIRNTETNESIDFLVGDPHEFVFNTEREMHVLSENTTLEDAQLAISYALTKLNEVNFDCS